MAIFKPEMKSSDFTSFTGVCEFGILELSLIHI